MVSPITRWPTHAGFTPSPTEATVPAHSWPSQWIGRVAGMQIGHFAGEELHIGAADAHPLDVNHHLASFGGRGCTSWTDPSNGAVSTNARMVDVIESRSRVGAVTPDSRCPAPSRHQPEARPEA